MPMDINITLDPMTGKVSIITQEGTFKEGSEKLTALVDLLKEQGIEFELVGKPDTHRHDHKRLSVTGKLHG